MTTTAASYAHGPSPTPLLGETIGENLRRTVEHFGDREALVVRHQDFRATYRQLWEQVGLAARALLARGIRTGDRVGIWSPNRYEWVVLQYATARVAKCGEHGSTLALSGASPARSASRLRALTWFRTGGRPHRPGRGR